MFKRIVFDSKLKQAQSENLDLAAASDMSLVVMEELQEKREGGNAFEELERNAAKYCANWKIPATENKRRKKLPQWLKNYVVTEKGIATEQPESSFRTDIFLPILDCLLLELRRFNSETSIIVSGVQSLKPGSKSFLDIFGYD